MYVSTIGLWGPGRLISDGFDNIIRTFTLERGLGRRTVKSSVFWGEKGVSLDFSTISTKRFEKGTDALGGFCQKVLVVWGIGKEAHVFVCCSTKTILVNKH